MLLASSVLLALLLGLSQGNLLSHTVERVSQIGSHDLCLNIAGDLTWISNFNLTQYKRQPHLDHTKHRRALDSGSQQANTGSRLQHIYEQPLLLPGVSIQNSISNLGDTRRLERALVRLMSGRPIKIVALGGSVTVGHGVLDAELGWVKIFYNWVNSTFPHPEHQLLNMAIPAVTSSYVAPCILGMLPENVDIVILEFTFNDGERATTSKMEDPTRLGMEQLLRKVMRMDRRPAVINLHYHPFNNYQHFWDGAQDQIELLMKFYSVTSLSMRISLHRFLTDSPWVKPFFWREKDVHPSCVGHRFVADVLIGFIQDMAAQILLLHDPQPQQHLPHPDVLLEKLPQPLFEGNFAEKPEKCILNDDFKVLENGIKGWEWGDDSGRHKFGFLSWRPKDAIVLRVPLDDFLAHLGGERSLLVAVGTLMSHERNGCMRITCIKGCSCPPRELNSHYDGFGRSMVYWKGVNASVDEGSNHCELYVENLDQTTSGEHRLKITSMLVSMEAESFVESWS